MSERDVRQETLLCLRCGLGQVHWCVPLTSTSVASYIRYATGATAGIQMRANSWIPIETAPKTSRHILVWTPANHCAALVVWGTAYESAGRWEHAYGSGHRLCDEPSHWRPLPPAPGVDGGEV